jgi:hypothetical protein
MREMRGDFWKLLEGCGNFWKLLETSGILGPSGK